MQYDKYVPTTDDGGKTIYLAMQWRRGDTGLLGCVADHLDLLLLVKILNE